MQGFRPHYLGDHILIINEQWHNSLLSEVMSDVHISCYSPFRITKEWDQNIFSSHNRTPDNNVETFIISRIEIFIFKIYFVFLSSHFLHPPRPTLSELVAPEENVFLPRDPERSPRLMKPQDVVVLVGHLGCHGSHGWVPGVVTTGVGADVDDSCVLG